MGLGGISDPNWKVRRPFETKIFVLLFRRSPDVLILVTADSSSPSLSNRPPKILIRLFRITSMVVAYIFDMESPGITKSSMWETYRQRCNVAMIAFFFGRVKFHIRILDKLVAHTGQSTCLDEQKDKSDNKDMSRR